MSWERSPISMNPARILPGARPHPGGRRGVGEHIARIASKKALVAQFRRELRALCAWWRA